ncbi:HypC/HybG/HupF family hydrogenase formation chaperone [Rhodococcus sp. NPDC003348]
MTATDRTTGPDPDPIGPELAADLADTALALARRFHAGATLWVVSPQWEPHAHHVAVEFVHPVIMGKRALPSVSLVEPDPVAQCRVATRPGDVILAVASADQQAVREIVRRAPAWGADTIWIGCGPRPAPGAATHVLWVDSDDPMVPATGRFVLLYHLLWELTHVCFEHPGLLTAPDCTDEVCVTCSDEGRLGEVVWVADDTGTAPVRTADGQEQVDVSLLGRVAAGDLVLVHGGVAITRLDTGDLEAGPSESGEEP